MYKSRRGFNLSDAMILLWVEVVFVLGLAAATVVLLEFKHLQYVLPGLAAAFVNLVYVYFRLRQRIQAAVPVTPQLRHLQDTYPLNVTAILFLFTLSITLMIDRTRYGLATGLCLVGTVSAMALYFCVVRYQDTFGAIQLLLQAEAAKAKEEEQKKRMQNRYINIVDRQGMITRL